MNLNKSHPKKQHQEDENSDENSQPSQNHEMEEVSVPKCLKRRIPKSMLPKSIFDVDLVERIKNRWSEIRSGARLELSKQLNNLVFQKMSEFQIFQKICKIALNFELHMKIRKLKMKGSFEVIFLAKEENLMSCQVESNCQKKALNKASSTCLTYLFKGFDEVVRGGDKKEKKTLDQLLEQKKALNLSENRKKEKKKSKENDNPHNQGLQSADEGNQVELSESQKRARDLIRQTTLDILCKLNQNCETDNKQGSNKNQIKKDKKTLRLRIQAKVKTLGLVYREDIFRKKHEVLSLMSLVKMGKIISERSRHPELWPFGLAIRWSFNTLENRFLLIRYLMGYFMKEKAYYAPCCNSLFRKPRRTSPCCQNYYILGQVEKMRVKFSKNKHDLFKEVERWVDYNLVNLEGYLHLPSLLKKAPARCYKSRIQDELKHKGIEVVSFLVESPIIFDLDLCHFKKRKIKEKNKMK